MTVLIRQSSIHDFPPSVTTKVVDYDSVTSLVGALENQDAVVSTMANAALARQGLLIDAAIMAGVKRFIPSEFGSNPDNDKVNALPIFGTKVITQKALQEKVAAGNLSYSLITTGPFLDWGIGVGLLIDVKNKSIDFYDGGDVEFSTTSLRDIGKAVAGVLKHPDETKNRTVFVQSTKITQKRLLEIAKNVLGSDGWKENVVSVDDLLAQAYVDYEKEPQNFATWAIPMIKISVWGKEYGGAYERLDNELLDIKQVSEADIMDLIERYSK